MLSVSIIIMYTTHVIVQLKKLHLELVSVKTLQQADCDSHVHGTPHNIPRLTKILKCTNTRFWYPHLQQHTSQYEHKHTAAHTKPLLSVLLHTTPFDQCICHKEASYFTTPLRRLPDADQIFIMNHYIIQLDTFEGNLVVLWFHCDK